MRKKVKKKGRKENKKKKMKRMEKRKSIIRIRDLASMVITIKNLTNNKREDIDNKIKSIQHIF